MKRLIMLVIGLLWSLAALAADGYSFGVLSQRSPVLTAEYWNPILAYVGRKAGIDLRLKVTRTAPETNAAIARGDYDFVYTNTLFQPDNARAGYRIILRPRTQPIRGQIVTLEGSPIRTLADLNGHVVGFPSRTAFVGYAVPLDYLTRAGIDVQPTFGGNQEGIMGQLKAGKVVAAAVNSQVMKAFAAREGLRYRVLWQSEPYDDLPIAVHPRVPARVAAAVRKAFVGMDTDPEGIRILAASAAIIQQKPPFGFLPGAPGDYRSYVDFYKHTVVKN